MKLKLFLIVTALLASANVFADEICDETVEFTDDIFNLEITDFESCTDEALLFGDEVAWDGTTVAEVIPDDGVYHIYNGAQLAWIAEQVNTPSGGGMTDCVISLEANIDLSGFNWTPIGYSYDTPFAGTFIGNGYTVYGLNFDCSSYTHGGLFGCVIGTISNLRIESDNIVTSRRVTPSSSDSTKNGIGILAGSLDARNFDYNTKDYKGIIEDCSVTGSLTVNNSYGEAYYVGGIVGVNSGGELYRNFSNAEISAISTNDLTGGTDIAYVGGIAGFNTGVLSGFENIGELLDVNSSGSIRTDSYGSIYVSSANPNIGGITGGNSGEVIYSIASCPISVSKFDSAYDDNYANIGGIVGTNSGIIEHCIHTESLTLTFDQCDSSAQINAGGIAGISAGEISDDEKIISTAIISDCLNHSNLLMTDILPKKNFGGIVGLNSNIAATVTDCLSDGHINIEQSYYTSNIGGVAGISYGIVDSCTSNTSIDVNTAVSASIGGIAGIAYNTISDCISETNTISLTSDSPTALLYNGGIAGETFGRIRRCTSESTLNTSGAFAYTGGIVGYAELNSAKSIVSISGEGLISKCTSNSDIECGNIAGGIAGDILNATVQRCTSNSNISGALGAGGIAGRANSSTFENCFVSGTISAQNSAGASYEFTNSDNIINMTYFAPVLSGTTNHAISIADKARYVTTRSYLNTDITNIGTVDGITAVNNKTASTRSTFGNLNFNSVWTMGETSPVLQYSKNSNALNSFYDYTETRMYFHVSLENPQVGQTVYVALYDEHDRFCGTVSAICQEENINSTGTRADFALQYSYSYWDIDTWEKTDGLPLTYKAFTWDSKTGMNSLSTVDEGMLEYYFE